MAKIDINEAELSVLHGAVKRQLDRLLQAKNEGHNVDENTVVPILKRLKKKTSMKSSKKKAQIEIVA